MNTLSPIVLFTYKRLNTLKQTVAALLANSLAASSDLIIYSDGPKSSKEENLIAEVRAYIKNMTGFKTITIHESSLNKGLANSIIDGVKDVINQYGKVIVLEDDLIVSQNFLFFMNAALNFYQNNNKVFSVSGYGLKVAIPQNYEYDVYFTPRGLSWGWATWHDRWDTVDWGVKDFGQLITDKKAIQKLALGGTDLFPMLKKQMNHNLDSWAIRWFYSQFKSEQLTVYPILSKVRNIGFDTVATHTNVYNRYHITFDTTNNQKFIFIQEAMINHAIFQSFRRYFSVFSRIFYGRIISPMYRLKHSIFKL
jgi:hypothetical protein